jgi:hypothetical protein
MRFVSRGSRESGHFSSIGVLRGGPVDDDLAEIVFLAVDINLMGLVGVEIGREACEVTGMACGDSGSCVGGLVVESVEVDFLERLRLIVHASEV